MRLDPDVFEELQANYAKNVKNFKQQNSGLLIDKVSQLTEDAITTFIENTLHINDDTVITKRFIEQHFINFAICPVVVDAKSGYTTHVELMPDIICEEHR